jgi:hypothetical protein
MMSSEILHKEADVGYVFSRRGSMQGEATYTFRPTCWFVILHIRGLSQLRIHQAGKERRLTLERCP